MIKQQLLQQPGFTKKNRMIQKNTILTPTDKCGVWTVNTFHLYGGFKKKIATTSNFVKVSARHTRPNNWVKKKSKHVAIVLHTRKNFVKSDGSALVTFVNNCVLLKKRLTPRGKELLGPAPHRLRRKKFLSSFVGIV